MIVASAIKVGSLVCTMPAPARHHDIIRQMSKQNVHDYSDETQGFINDQGQFMNRRDAYQHALQCGQGTPRRDITLNEKPNSYDGPELFSEDLW